MASEVIEIRPQPGPQEAFLSSPADIAIYGGAAFGGKTYAALLEPLRHIDNPGFEAVIFRRTSPQITAAGGLWNEAGTLYPLVGGRPRESAPKRYDFPSGAKASFHHLQHDKNVYDWQGAQIPLIEFDELTHFSEHQFWYMLSRNRSACGVRPYMRATVNPDADSWVAKLIEWWIDQETGLAIPERSGVLRWFYRVDGTLHWYDSLEEAEAAHPDLAAVAPPKSLTFIAASIYDNRIGLAKDPGYLSNLQSLQLVERERLLGGNWKIRAVAGNVFRRSWWEIVKAVPSHGRRVRFWDLAATKDGGDWTVGVLMQRTGNRWYILDVKRGQWSVGERDRIIRNTAKTDGPKVLVRWEEEPGSSGKGVTRALKEKLAGRDARGRRSTGKKVTRAGPMSAQAEAGNVFLLEGEWNEGYIDRLDAFPSEKVPDDEADASSGAFMELAIKPNSTTVS